MQLYIPIMNPRGRDLHDPSLRDVSRRKSSARYGRSLNGVASLPVRPRAAAAQPATRCHRLTMQRYLPIVGGEQMNRRKDELIPIEVDILAAVLELQKRGTSECHGFLIGKTLETAGGSGSLVGHGTLY